MAYDPFHTLEFRAPQCLAIFRWSPDENQAIKPVLAGVTAEAAGRALEDFVVTEECQRPPHGWERVTYRGPFQEGPPGIYELPRDFLDAPRGASPTTSNGSSVGEIRRVLSRSLPLLIGRVTEGA